MSLKTFLSGDASTPGLPKESEGLVRVDPGPFIGIVKSNQDPTRMGRLGVLIPSRDNTYEPSTGQLITCEYLAPFYGAKTSRYVEEKDPYNYKGSQHSYGMWMIPPDIDTKVLVIFAEGRPDQAFWIGCIQDPLVNHMIPGIAASERTGLENTGVDEDSKQSMYGTEILPAGEINRVTLDRVGDKASDPTLKRPIHPFAETLRQQGLIQDDVRGTTTSSARREAPSNVFGISTPGRRDPSSAEKIIGVTNSQNKEILDRLTGHTFVMDDGDTTAGGNNQLIRLRSASGHQLLFHDTKGVVYIANGSGNVWMEFSANGSIDIYAGGGVNIRSRGDMNFHSDTNINMFARKQIKMSSVGKLVIDGGAVQTYADYDIQSQARYGSITTKAPEGSIVSYAKETQIHMASGQTHLTGSQVHFNSIPTSPNIVATYERTTVQEPSGTGTKREAIPDVNPANKYTYGPLRVDQNANITMSGMRVPTHEPYPFHFDKVVTFVGTDPNSKLSNVPGTPEFIAQRNRESDNPVVRMGQFQSDLQYKLQKDGLGQVATAINKVVASQPIGDIQKIQQAANEFATNYSKTFNLKDLGPFNISPIAEGVSSTIQQTVNSLTGANVNLLSNQVFVNQAGILYSAGNLNQGISSAINTVSGALGTVKNVTNTAGNILKSYNTVKDTLFGSNAGDALYTDYGDNTSVSSLISTQGPFAGGNVFGTTPGGGNIFSPGGVTGLPTIPGISIPGLGQFNQIVGLTNQAIGTYNVVNNIYKNVFGSEITSVTEISSLVNGVGTEIASIGKSIGSVFGFGGFKI